MLRLEDRLDEETEDLIYRTIGSCIEVHKALGAGLLEKIYVRAICIELTEAGIPFEVQKSYPVSYRGKLLCDQTVDIVVAGKVLLEIKAVDRRDCPEFRV